MPAQPDIMFGGQKAKMYLEVRESNATKESNVVKTDTNQLSHHHLHIYIITEACWRTSRIIISCSILGRLKIYLPNFILSNLSSFTMLSRSSYGFFWKVVMSRSLLVLFTL